MDNEKACASYVLHVFRANLEIWISRVSQRRIRVARVESIADCQRRCSRSGGRRRSTGDTRVFPAHFQFFFTRIYYILRLVRFYLSVVEWYVSKLSIVYCHLIFHYYTRRLFSWAKCKYGWTCWNAMMTVPIASFPDGRFSEFNVSIMWKIWALTHAEESFDHRWFF